MQSRVETNCISCEQHCKAAETRKCYRQFTLNGSAQMKIILKISVAPHCWRVLLLLLDQGGHLLDSKLVLGDRGSRTILVNWRAVRPPRKRGVHCFGRRSANQISCYNLLLEHLGLLLLWRSRSWGVRNVHGSAWWCQLRLLAWTWHSVFSFCTK